MKKIREIAAYLRDNEIAARFQQAAAFCVSFYLTMDMFVEMVRGDLVKEWFFRGIAFVYETSKLSVLKKSFTLTKHRLPTRALALALMFVSVTWASMSAIRTAGAAQQAANVETASSQETIDDLVRQRDSLQAKLDALPATWKTAALDYQAQITAKQSEIDSARKERSVTTIEAQERGGIFDDVASFVGRGVKGWMVRFAMFVMMIVLIECILYTETYFVALAERRAAGIEEAPSLLERVKRWKIFHRQPMSDDEKKDVIRQTLDLITAPSFAKSGETDDLF